MADSIERIVLGLAFGGLGVIAFKLLAEHFTGLSARAWALARILAGVIAAAIGAWLLVQASPDSVRETRCRVFETDIQETVELDDDVERRYLDVMVRVRWRADGRTFTLRRPSRLKQFSAKSISREELAARYRPGHELRCSHMADRPDYILLAAPEEVLLRRRTGGLAFVLAGCVVVVVGILAWRRTPDSRVRIRGGSVGLTGLALMAVVLVGLILRGAGSTWLGTGAAILGAAAFAALLVRELLRERSALDQVRRRLKHAEHWPDPTRSPLEESTSFNLYEDDRVTGLLEGARVWAALSGPGASLEVELEAWPEKLEVRPAGARDDTATVTGDEEFDDLVALVGPDQIWRPLLTATVRDHLRRLVGEKGGAIDAERRLKLALATADVDDLPWLLDDAAALARSLPAVEREDQACARVFELARSEPVVAVRFGHYRWLLARNWNAPQVLRTAARDKSSDIAEWARSRLPPSFGTYR